MLLKTFQQTKRGLIINLLKIGSLASSNSSWIRNCNNRVQVTNQRYILSRLMVHTTRTCRSLFKPWRLLEQIHLLLCLVKAVCWVIAKICLLMTQVNSSSKELRLSKIHMLKEKVKIWCLNLKLHQMMIFFKLRFSSLLSQVLIRRLSSSKFIGQERYLTFIAALDAFWRRRAAWLKKSRISNLSPRVLYWVPAKVWSRRVSIRAPRSP